MSDPTQSISEPPDRGGAYRGKRAPSRSKGPHVVVKNLISRFKVKATRRKGQNNKGDHTEELIKNAGE